MTGPEHFKTAEQLLADNRGGTAEEPYYLDEAKPALLAALVHATLANAAATALTSWYRSHDLEADRQAWLAVAGTQSCQAGASE